MGFPRVLTAVLRKAGLTVLGKFFQFDYICTNGQFCNHKPPPSQALDALPAIIKNDTDNKYDDNISKKT